MNDDSTFRCLRQKIGASVRLKSTFALGRDSGFNVYDDEYHFYDDNNHYYDNNNHYYDEKNHFYEDDNRYLDNNNHYSIASPLWAGRYWWICPEGQGGYSGKGQPILPSRQHYCPAGSQAHHYTLKSNVA